MKFIIRDDDLNYFSQPADIDQWYGDIFVKSIPVGFAAIPLVTPESDVYTDSEQQGSEKFPIGNNQALVSYVQQQACIEILQHGTTHEVFDGTYEYAGDVETDRAKTGRHVLESAFETPVTVFVPPHDWLGRKGLQSVIIAGMNVIRGRGTGLRTVQFSPKHLYYFVLLLVRRLVLNLRHGTFFPYPYVLDFGTHKEVCSYRLEDQDVFAGLKYVAQKDGVFVVVVHLHQFTEEKKQRLHDLIEAAQRMGFSFVSASSVFR